MCTGEVLVYVKGYFITSSGFEVQVCECKCMLICMCTIVSLFACGFRHWRGFCNLGSCGDGLKAFGGVRIWWVLLRLMRKVQWKSKHRDSIFKQPQKDTLNSHPGTRREQVRKFSYHSIACHLLSFSTACSLPMSRREIYLWSECPMSCLKRPVFSMS